MEKEKYQSYLDYLDKEMTIMGILSTFSLVVVGFVLKETYSISPDSGVHLLVILGSIFLLLATLFYYDQRSFLAWSYGHICYSISCDNSKEVDTTLYEIENTRKAWCNYFIGNGFSFVGIFTYLVAYAFYIIKINVWPYKEIVLASLISAASVCYFCIRFCYVKEKRRKG